MFVPGEEPLIAQSSFPPPMAEPAAERFATLVRLAGGIAAELRAMLSPVGRELQELKERPRGSSPDLEHAAHRSDSPERAALSPAREIDERIESIRRRLLQAQDFVAELASAGELDPQEGQSEHDLVELVKIAVRAVEARAQRAGVAVNVVVLPQESARARIRVSPRSATLLVRELLAHALAATAKDRTVTITVGPEGAGEHVTLGSRIIVDDAGTSLPKASRRGMLALEVLPGTYGRPSTIPLYIATEIATCQGAILELGDSPAGGVRVMVTFPRVLPL